VPKWLPLAIACALSGAPAGAAVFFKVDYIGSVAVGADNEFKPELAAAGLTRLSVEATISLSGPAVVTYHFMGSDSGYTNVFRSGALTPFSEYNSNNFGAYTTKAGANQPILIGSVVLPDGLLSASFWNGLSNSGLLIAKPGDDGFGLFLPGTANRYSMGRYSGTELFFGFDDQRVHADNDHDDFIVRATISPISSVVPEPAAWAAMVLGFGLVGAAVRRRRKGMPPSLQFGGFRASTGS
jgi:hypothetical protein